MSEDLDKEMSHIMASAKITHDKALDSVKDAIVRLEKRNAELASTWEQDRQLVEKMNREMDDDWTKAEKQKKRKGVKL